MLRGRNYWFDVRCYVKHLNIDLLKVNEAVGQYTAEIIFN